MDTLTNNILDCALVFEGGGYRAAYTAGIARVLLEQQMYFDFVCGLSAGASHTVDYVSRDLHRTRWAFMGHKPTGVQIGGIPSLVRGMGYFNADYLYAGCVEDGYLPFDWDTFQANPTRIRIQAFERDSGRTLTFSKEDMPDVITTINLVRASSTLPGMMKPLPMDGRVLLDGGLGHGAGIPLHMAEEAGYHKFFFVATRPKGYRKMPPSKRDRMLYGVIARDHPYLRHALLTRWERYNDELGRMERLAREGRCLVVYPDEMPVQNSTLDTTRLEAAYDMGHAQGMRDLPQWREFLFGAPDAGPHPDPADIRERIRRADGNDDYIVLEP